MTDKFLGIGINNYLNAPELSGCVNDIGKCCNLLTQKKLFSEPIDPKNLAACTNNRATTKGILNRLSFYISQLKPGDRFVFWYSGHGTQIPTRYNGEVDGLIESLCSYNFDFDKNDTWITDKEFVSLFTEIPESTNCIIILDSCFSGGMYKNNLVRRNPYPSIDYEIRHNIAKHRNIAASKLYKDINKTNVIFILASQENQVSSEMSFAGERYGAFTHYFWESIIADSSKSLRLILEDTVSRLQKDGYNQVPFVIAPSRFLDVPFLAKI